jgi:methylenetetrahydrofolate dehydrogenase (NADP+) / methenyltetrahydrofolate cyclohydrolase
LAVVIVGDDPASLIYINNKRITCDEVGIKSQVFSLKKDTSENELLEKIQKLNKDKDINGILVQLPLPAHINSDKVIQTIDPHKDVDGFHPLNVGKLALRIPDVRPCTPYGIMRLLKETKVQLKNSHVVIVGASNIVGRPVALELLLAGATISVCHRFTPNSPILIKQADVIIVAVGKQNFIKDHWLKKGVIIIDVGINRLKNGTITGDVDFENCKKKASFITPVPGGVGPMTVAMLMLNTLKCYQKQKPKH